jgi:hypothetical protein
MSIGSNHIVSKLEKNSKALPEQRLTRVIAKKNKDGEYESPNLVESKCVSVPVVNSLSEMQIKALMPHICGMVQNAQDEIIRELIIASGISSVNDAQISVEECIKYLDDSAKGNRVTSEYMQKWFTETYGEPAMEFICVQICKFDPEQLSTDQASTIEKRCSVLRDMFAGFGSGKYSPDIPKCKAILKFGEFLTKENWDSRMSVIQEKTTKIKKEKEDALNVDALGFGE